MNQKEVGNVPLKKLQNKGSFIIKFKSDWAY